MLKRWLAIAAVGALGLTVACGDAADPDEANPDGSPDGSPDASATATPEGDPAERPTTISGALAARNAEIAENQLAIEAAIQSCMTAQGFEYTPNAGGGDQFVGAFDSANFAEQFGYGVSTLTGGGFPDLGLGGGASADPNQQYVESLSPSQSAAYYEALYGTAPDGTSSGVGEFSGSSGGTGSTFTIDGTGGCTGEANLEVFGEEQPLPFTEDLFDGMRQIATQVESDPRVLKAWESWATCMADRGYPYADEDEIVRDLGARFTAITGQSSPRSGDGFSLFVESGPAAEPDYDVAALEALQDEEREIAAVGQECRDEHVADVESDVRDQAERAYLEDNPDLLDQLLGPASGS